MKKTIKHVKNLWNNQVIPLALAGSLIFGGLTYVSYALLKPSLENTLKNQVQNVSFEEIVLEASEKPINVKQEGIFRYVDINNDSIYDAVIFPAPTRYGAQEIIKLKGGKKNEKKFR